jgi:hypothetical protein
MISSSIYKYTMFLSFIFIDDFQNELLIFPVDLKVMISSVNTQPALSQHQCHALRQVPYEYTFTI